LQDEQIIQAVLNGQSDMFRLLYRSYATNCWRVSLGIVKSEDLAQDAVQNAFLKAFQRLRTFQGNSTFKTWLLRIVINESLKIVKANKRYLYLEHDKDILINNQDAFTLDDEILNIEKNELQQILHTALAQLPNAMQLLLTLFYLEEMSIKEIMVSTNFSGAKVKTGLHRARKELKILLNKKHNFV